MDTAIVIWWLTFGRLWCGLVGCAFALRTARRLRDEKVIREAVGRNGMESLILSVLIFCVWCFVWSLGLTALNAALILPDVMAGGPYTTRRLVGSTILASWSFAMFLASVFLACLMPRLHRMAQDYTREKRPTAPPPPEAAS